MLVILYNNHDVATWPTGSQLRKLVTPELDHVERRGFHQNDAQLPLLLFQLLPERPPAADSGGCEHDPRVLREDRAVQEDRAEVRHGQSDGDHDLDTGHRPARHGETTVVSGRG